MDHKSSGPSSRCALVAIELQQFHRRQAAAAVGASPSRCSLCVTVEPRRCHIAVEMPQLEEHIPSSV